MTNEPDDERTLASTKPAAQSPNETARQQPRRESWAGPLRWLADHFCPIPPDPPADAEPSTRKLWRDTWPAPLRCLAELANPMPWDPPHRFPQAVGTLHDSMGAPDDDLADELLADAERLFDEADARAESAERRATTLLGMVAIAAAVALTGGGLVLDPAKIHGGNWRMAFAIGFGLLVFLLVLTAFRASGASTRTFNVTSPSDDRIFERAKTGSAGEAKALRAAYLLHGFGRNNEVAALKVGYLRAAAFWFRGALLVLFALTVMLAGYVIDTRGAANKPAGRSATTPGAGAPAKTKPPTQTTTQTTLAPAPKTTTVAP